MSENLERLFTGGIAPGIYRLASRASTATIAKQAEHRGWRCFYLDGRQIASKNDFLQVCAKAMQFPDYFGYNWDALEDSLRDLSWAPSQRGYLVLFDGAARLATSSPQDFAVALDILRAAIEYWRATTTPMVVLLRGLGRLGGTLPKL